MHYLHMQILFCGFSHFHILQCHEVVDVLRIRYIEASSWLRANNRIPPWHLANLESKIREVLLRYIMQSNPLQANINFTQMRSVSKYYQNGGVTKSPDLTAGSYFQSECR